MSTIPADPTMVLGQIVQKERLDKLQEIADALKPQVQARDKYQALLLASHSLEGLYLELSNMENIDAKKLEPMQKKITEINGQLIEASMNLAEATASSQAEAAKIRAEAGFSSIGVAPESPYDMTAVTIKGAPVSTDSINLDSQFFRTESQSTGDQIASMVQKQTGDAKMAKKAKEASDVQQTVHKVEGTLVIVCNCTHKIANFIQGTMDGRRAVEAWNQTFPDDYLDTDVKSLKKAATKKSKGKGGGKGDKEKALHILTGTTFGSSFVAIAHILESEEAPNPADKGKLEKMIKEKMALNSATGNIGDAEKMIEEAKEMASKSSLNAHCTLICSGSIPTFAPNDHQMFLRSVQPSTQGNASTVNQIADMASEGGDGAEAKIGSQLMSLNKNFLNDASSTLASTKVRYIDMESMMTAFENYLKDVKGYNAGNDVIGGGVPVNFYLRKIDKKTVAKTYISQFYPNGVDTFGAVGQGGGKPKPAE